MSVCVAHTDVYTKEHIDVGSQPGVSGQLFVSFGLMQHANLKWSYINVSCENIIDLSSSVSSHTAVYLEYSNLSQHRNLVMSIPTQALITTPVLMNVLRHLHL